MSTATVPVAGVGAPTPTAPGGTTEIDPVVLVDGVLTDLGARAHLGERPDLVEAAARARALLAQAWFRVAVTGEFKSGKSSLVNGLVDATVCAVDDDITSLAPVEVGFTAEPTARVWTTDDAHGDGTDVPVERAADHSRNATTTLVRVGLPRRLLEAGLVLVDTPGTGGVASATAMVSASALAEAHAVLFVTDASQELTAPEMAALVDATRRCGRVVLVVTRIDISPHWRTIVAADRAHLAERGIDVAVVPVSNELRRQALATDDVALNDESGFPELLRVIATDLIGSARRIMVTGALAEAERILGHLRAPFEGEAHVLSPPTAEGADGDHGADPEPTVDPVRAARDELTVLRERSASWQQLLADGMTDLAAAVDADLRTGFRALLREFESRIDEVDPDEAWPELEPVVHRRVAETVDANLTLLRERAGTLTNRLLEQIGDAEPAPVDRWLDDPAGSDDGDAAASSRGGDAALGYDDGAEEGARSRVHSAFRAGYGGAMPVMVIGGMALGVLGLGTLVLPLAGVAGALAGRRAIGDDRERQLKQRRQQARTVVRTHLDEVVYRASVEHKAAQRRVQRALRDHVARRVAELTASAERTYDRARRAAEADAAERADRIEVVARELVALDALARRCEAARLATTSPGSVPPQPGRSS